MTPPTKKTALDATGRALSRLVEAQQFESAEDLVVELRALLDDSIAGTAPEEQEELLASALDALKNAQRATVLFRAHAMDDGARMAGAAEYGRNPAKQSGGRRFVG